MIYLIRNHDKKESLLKIGFSDILEKRLYQHYTCNLQTILVKTREGDQIPEKYLLYSEGC